jgi:toxin ParE1/3/4
MAFRTTPQAEEALGEIWDYVHTASGSAIIARNLIQSIASRFPTLASHPHIGRARDEDLRSGLRSFPVGEYIIIYRVENEDVVILLVVRGDRDLSALLPENS